MPGPDAPTAYVRLGLGIEQHLQGYVDAYFGPDELRKEAETNSPPSLDVMDDLADSLGESLDNDLNLAPERKEFLSSELGAMRMTLRILSEEQPDFFDEVQNLYGVEPQWVDEEEFRDAHHALEQVLPGEGPLKKRVGEFKERARISVEVATPVIQWLAVELRNRTLEHFDLPPGEQFETSFVVDKPWYAYNWYLGNLKSLIEINQEFALELWELPFTIAHEAYPGHHTEHAIKEHLLFRQEERLEHSILLSNTPSSLIAEGIATNALRAVASEEEITDIMLQAYKMAGLSKSDGERACDFINAGRPLSRVLDNQALLLFRDGLPENEVLAYGMRYGLREEKDARQRVRFLQDPLWRSYGFNYTLGRDLVADFLSASPDRNKAFEKLLSEPITPRLLHKSIAENSLHEGQDNQGSRY